MAIVVSEINYYPIKSCAGISKESAELDARGIKHDREFMVVDENGKFVSQRQLPRMALIQPYVDDAVLEVKAPDMPDKVIAVSREGRSIDALVHDDKCAAIDQGDNIAEWLSNFLKGNYRLVRMADDFVRKIDPRYAQRAHDQVGFADAYPLLLVSQESLDDLNSRLKKPVPMNRFRPNIVISGNGIPYVEDSLKRISIGDAHFNVVKPCSRCVMTGVDQNSAETGKEPLATLAKYRRQNGKVMFGQNIIHERAGRISVRDAVHIDAYKPDDARYVKTGGK